MQLATPQKKKEERKKEGEPRAESKREGGMWTSVQKSEGGRREAWEGIRNTTKEAPSVVKRCP